MINKNFKKWFKYALIRAIRTIAQTMLASIGVAELMNQVNWIEVISASVLAGILSILMSVAGIPEVDKK